MSTLFLVVAVVISLLIVVLIYRIMAGPTVFDRMVGVGLVGTNVIVILVLVGFLYERIEMFVDLALAYAMLNFIGLIALARYFEEKGKGS